MRAHAADMAALAEPGTVLIEFGSGSSTKTELLLAKMRDLYAYVPIDISGAALDEAQARIEERFADLTEQEVRTLHGVVKELRYGRRPDRPKRQPGYKIDDDEDG